VTETGASGRGPSQAPRAVVGVQGLEAAVERNIWGNPASSLPRPAHIPQERALELPPRRSCMNVPMHRARFQAAH
jgi:hypothetical protein